MAKIGIRNLDQIAESFPLMDREITAGAISAVNSTATYIRNLLAEKIDEGTGLQSKDVKSRIYLDRAKKAQAYAKLTASASLIPLKFYSPKFTKAKSGMGILADISLTKSDYQVPRGFTHNQTKLQQRKGRKAYPLVTPMRTKYQSPLW